MKFNNYPNTWTVGRLDNFITLQRGFDLPIQRRTVGKYPIIASNGKVGTHKRFKVKGPGIITGRSGTIGKVIYENMDFWPLNTTLYVKNFHKNCERYVYYFLQQFNLSRFSNGTGVPTLNRNEVHPEKICFPPEKEQKKIAEILSTWDRAIELTEKLIVKSKLFYSATSQKIKEKYMVNCSKYTFDDLFEIKIGGTPSRRIQEFWEEDRSKGYLWVSISDLKQKLVHSTSERITDLGVTKSNVKLIPKGTVVMSFKLSIGKKAILNQDSFTNEAIAAFLPKKKDLILNNFIYHSLDWVRLDSEVDHAVKGRTLNKDKLRRLTLLVPSIEIQKKIVKLLETIDLKTSYLEKLAKKLKNQKKGLMQQLLTGKRRVKVS